MSLNNQPKIANAETKEGFHSDANQMAPSLNQLSSLSAPANHSEASKHQFGIPSKESINDIGLQ